MSNDTKPLIQTSGKEGLVVHRTLNQVWGDTGLTKYNTLDASEYETYLNELNTSDLRSHAIKIGIAPIPERGRLQNALLTQFKTYAAQFLPTNIVKPEEKPVSPEVLKILAEGR